VIGLVAARRQRRRRARIPPNSNTATTTMISTHNHVDMAASLVGAGAGQADTTAAHPGQTTPPRPGDLPGRDRRPRCARARGGPCTPRLARRSGLVGRVPARPGRRPRAGPGGPSLSCHAQPARPSRIDQHHRRGPSRRQPTRRDHSEADRRGVWRGREEFALLGWGNNPSMVVLMRNGRRRAAGAEPMVRAFGETRTCAEDGCTARLSRYNPARCCAIHHGWDGQEMPRPRRRRS